MLTPAEVHKLREELVTCTNPFFIYHDDPDGLASYLLFYRFLREGKGFVLKAVPHIKKEMVRHVVGASADKVFVLDIAMMDQDFVDALGMTVVWVDHHQPQDLQRVKYFNPRLRGKNIPTPVLCWQVVGEPRPQDLWIATVGSIGDWYFPEYVKAFREQYPDLLPEDITTVEEALFNPKSKVATLVKVFSFNLKGKMKDVERAVQALVRIQSPNEILNQSSPEGKLVYERYEAVNKEYEELKQKAVAEVQKQKDLIRVFTYSKDELSLTKDLANELCYLYPDNVIVLGRKKSGDIRMSLRSTKMNILPAMERALAKVRGRGGGHEHACGASVIEDDFPAFLEAFGEGLKTVQPAETS